MQLKTISIRADFVLTSKPASEEINKKLIQFEIPNDGIVSKDAGQYEIHCDSGKKPELYRTSLHMDYIPKEGEKMTGLIKRLEEIAPLLRFSRTENYE